MAPLDRPYMSSYQSAIVTIALPCTIFDMWCWKISDVAKTLKSMLWVIYPATSCKVLHYNNSMSFKVIKNGTNQKPTCDFLLVSHCNYMPIFYHFWDIMIYWLKIRVTVSNIHKPTPRLLARLPHNVKPYFAFYRMQFQLTSVLEICSFGFKTHNNTKLIRTTTQ